MSKSFPPKSTSTSLTLKFKFFFLNNPSILIILSHYIKILILNLLLNLLFNVIKPIFLKIITLLLILLQSLLSNCSSSQNIQLSPEELNNSDFLLEKGREAYLNEDYDMAIQLFQLVIDRFPDRNYNASWALYETGMSYYIQGDYSLARQFFLKILQTYLIPKQPRILSLRLIRKIDQNIPHHRSTYIDQ